MYILFTPPPTTTTTTTTTTTSTSTATTAPVLSIPKELWRLVDVLWSGDALREKDLFVMDADPIEVSW